MQILKTFFKVENNIFNENILLHTITNLKKMGFEHSTQCILHNLYVSKFLLVSLKKELYRYKNCKHTKKL